MSVCCECCVLSGEGLCVGLITGSEGVVLKCGVSECDCEAPKGKTMAPKTCRSAKRMKTKVFIV